MDQRVSNFERRHQRVIDYIYSNLNGDLSLDQLAEIACYSRFHWHRVYQSHTEESIAQTVRRLRVVRAKNELVSSEKPLKEIAEICGYASVQSFSHGFRAMVGQPPKAFRQHGKAQIVQLLSQKGIENMYEVKIENHNEREVACVPHQGHYTEISRSFDKLGAFGAIRPELFQSGELLGVYYSDPTVLPPEEWQSAACITIQSGMDLPEGLEQRKIVGGRYAELLYKGDYSGLNAVYQWIFGEWLPNSDETPREEPPIEIYLNNPKEVAPSELLTKICLAIE